MDTDTTDSSTSASRMNTKSGVVETDEIAISAQVKTTGNEMTTLHNGRTAGNAAQRQTSTQSVARLGQSLWHNLLGESDETGGRTEGNRLSDQQIGQCQGRISRNA